MGTKGMKMDTWQKRVVQDAVDRFESPFTARDVCQVLSKSRPKVSRATVYRVLSDLCSEGRVKEVSLPDGRRVCATVKTDGAMCILECSDCGRLAACVAPQLDPMILKEARRQKLKPLQAAVYLRASCSRRECEHLEKKVPLYRTRRKAV